MARKRTPTSLSRSSAQGDLRAPARTLGFAALAGLAGAALGAAGLPSSYLFGALLAGLAVALAAPDSVRVPGPAFTAAQAVTGVVLGAYLQSSSLAAVAGSWLPVALVSAATLLLSLAAGAVLARTTGTDATTAALGLVAGGASGIVAMADELGADDRLVAFMQYLRVLVVVLLTPVIAALAFPGHPTGSAPGGGPLLGHPGWWAITLAAAVAGGVTAKGLRVPAASLLGPLVVSGAVTLLAPAGTFSVPSIVRELAFGLIGAQVGLRFTPDAVRAAGRLLVPTLAAVLALMASCFVLALGLAATTPAGLLDSYLATTPGGLYAVLAVAFGAGADTTFIVAVQGLRLLVMVLLAPIAVRWIASRARRPA